MEEKSFFSKSASQFANDHAFNGIDVVKLIGAILVVMIHIPAKHWILFDVPGLAISFWIKNYLCRIAVPFYFTAAGFLLFRKVDPEQIDSIRIRDYCLKILRLLGVWVFVIFVGWIEHLWYLSALVVAVLVLTFLFKKRVPIGWIIVIAVIAYLIGLLGVSYYGFLEPLKSNSFVRVVTYAYETLFGSTRNGLFFGLIFVLMGALFARKRIVLNRAAAWVGFLASEAALFCEAYWLKNFSHAKDYDMYVFLLPATFFLFYIASHVNLKNKPVYARIRAIGVLIYFGHTLVMFFVQHATRFTEKRFGIDVTGLSPVLVISITVLLSILIERLSKKQRFSWLKYLYS